MYRISFYNLPASRDGGLLLVPNAGTPAEIATQYVKHRTTEIFTELQFRRDQASIVVTTPTVTGNYIRIARTTTATVGDYASDDTTDITYAWIMDIIPFPTADGDERSWIVYLDIDPWITFLYSQDKTARDASKIYGRLMRTSRFGSNIMPVRRIPPLKPDWNGVQPKYYGPNPRSLLAGIVYRYSVILCATTPDGDLVQLILRATESSERTQKDAVDSVYDRLVYASNAVSYESNTLPGNPTNISVSKVYIIPDEWIQTDMLASGTWTIHAKRGSGNIDFKTATQFSHDHTGTIEPLLVATYSIREIINLKEATDPTFKPYTTVFIRTPKQAIPIDCDMSIDQSSESRVYAYLAISNGGMNDDGISIVIKVGDQVHDVSDDFTVDFAINEQALRQVQHKELTALQGISTVVGTLGGVVGGVASGNYFGAVQSLVGGANSLGGMVANRTTPATMRAGGSAAGTLSYATLIYFEVYYEPVNKYEIDQTAENYGYELADAVYENIGLPDNEACQMENARILPSVQFGETYKQRIAQDLARGMCFKNL